MTEEQLRQAMRRRFQAMSMREWCRLTGCHATHVSEFMNGKRTPPSDLLKALNMRVDYVKNKREVRQALSHYSPDNTAPLVEALEKSIPVLELAAAEARGDFASGNGTQAWVDECQDALDTTRQALAAHRANNGEGE